jgi:hypothetical protein
MHQRRHPRTGVVYSSDSVSPDGALARDRQIAGTGGAHRRMDRFRPWGRL